MIRKYRVALDTNPQGDVLGGLVGADNAALTLMTKYVSGPELEHLLPDEHQIREGTTADSRRPGRGKNKKATDVRLRYHVFFEELS